MIFFLTFTWDKNQRKSEMWIFSRSYQVKSNVQISHCNSNVSSNLNEVILQEEDWIQCQLHLLSFYSENLKINSCSQSRRINWNRKDLKSSDKKEDYKLQDLPWPIDSKFLLTCLHGTVSQVELYLGTFSVSCTWL